jgi:hypothetical protein
MDILADRREGDNEAQNHQELAEATAENLHTLFPPGNPYPEPSNLGTALPIAPFMLVQPPTL